MPYRLISVFLVAALALMFAFGAFDDPSSASDTTIVNGVLTEVDGVIDNALHEGTFDWLTNTLSGAANTVEGGVEGLTD